LSLGQPEFESRLAAVEARIQNAVERCGRKRSEITLVAVSKKFSAAKIREAYNAGLRDFGENYVQEFAEKATALQDLRDCTFHLIGHLQSNKAQLASRLFQVVQTVDSEKLMKRLDRTAQEQGRSIEVLFEIKLSSEASNTGAAPEDIPGHLKAAEQCAALNITCLMTMPPWREDAERSRPFFRQLAQLAHQNGLPKLSMGMSGDFEVAIEEGSTVIRVGTALFGARPKPANALS
jgi:pyridoxal phosphate enzyme (YggS family)